MPSPLLAPVAVSGSVTFFLWINNTSTAPVAVTGSFDYLLPGGGSLWNNISSPTPHTLQRGFHAANFTLQIGQPPLTYGTQLSFSLNATARLPNGNVTLYWGSIQVHSHGAVFLSQYETMPQPNPVAILDHSGNPTTYFSLNPDPGNNIVLIQVSVISAFGLLPPGYVPFPYSLIPYIVVAGVAASGGSGGAMLYRRRRRKSYLIPFDHFSTMTGGGLDGGTVVAVEGNTGSGKTLLLEQLMAEDLRNGRPCVFVSTGDFPNSIRTNMKTMGVDVSGYEQNGLLTFVDGYSAEAGQESREKVFVPSIGDLTTLGI